VVDKHGGRIGEYVSLAGTQNNCAGGRSPWDTWLTCEEAESLSGQTKPHGYVFEVDPYDQDANRDPKPIKALGRYAHEALVIDPHTGAIYLTEDAGTPNGLLYRWTPSEQALPLGRGVLRELADDAGVLEALKASTLRGAHVPDLSVATDPGTTYRVDWVAVPDRDAGTVSTRRQFTNAQITRSRKFEGMWWGDGGAYFVCSFARFADGSAAQHDGQVWFLDPLADTIELKLHFAYTPLDQDGDPDGPDNITVSPLRRAHHRRGRRGQAAPGRLDRQRRHVLLRPQRRPRRLRVHRAELLPQQEDPVRQHPGTRLRVRHPGPVHEAAVTMSAAVWASRRADLRPEVARADREPNHLAQHLVDRVAGQGVHRRDDRSRDASTRAPRPAGGGRRCPSACCG
jgi:hypothetical protein